MRAVSFALVMSVFSGTVLAQSSPDEAPATEAAPTDFVCDGHYRTDVVVDGLQVDWESEATDAPRIQTLIAGEPEYDWTGGNDASFKFWCRYTPATVYLAIVGRDQQLVDDSGRGDGDRLEIWIGAPDDGDPARLDVPLWPALGDGLSSVSFGAGAEGEVTGARAEVATRQSGFFAEIGIPTAQVPGLANPFGPVPFVIVQRDIDNDAENELEVGVATAPVEPTLGGTLHFSGVEARIAEIQRQLVLDADAHGAPRGLTWAEFGGAPGLDLAMMLGDRLIVTGEGFADFAWTAVTVRSTDDHEMLSIEAHDLDGDGVAEIVYRFARTQNLLTEDGQIRQEFVLVYQLVDRALVRLFAQEVANERPGMWRVEMPIEYRAQREGVQMRLGRPVGGVERETYIDVDVDDATDYEPMLLPWSSSDRIAWTRSGDQWRAVHD